MHLVSALTAGIKGAENGQATFTLRGTGTPTTVFRDFEGQDPVSSGEAISLDANGGAEVYVDVLTTVTVHSSLGIEVREFVAGYSAPGIELRSQSFTGQAYDDGSGRTITGTAQPTTLQAIADRWLDVNLAKDWKILDGDGNEVSIPDALAGATGLFINPRASEYGAEGDGVNNDLPALDAATADAALIDGTVVLPHGIYRIADTWVIPSNVNIFGLGVTSVAVAINNAANADAISVTAPTSTDRFRTQFIEGFRIESQQATTGVGLQLNEPAVSLRDISVASLNAFMTGHAFELLGNDGDFVHMNDIRVDLHGTAELVSATDANWQGELRVSNSYFRFADTITTGGIQMHDGSIMSSTFDHSLVDAAASAVVDITMMGDDVEVSIVGNRFTDPAAGGTGITCIRMNVITITGQATEAANIFGGLLQTRFANLENNLYRTWGLSARRRQNVDVLSNAGVSDVIDDVLTYETTHIIRSVTGAYTYTFSDAAAIGHHYTIIIKNTSGGNIQVTPYHGDTALTIGDGKWAAFRHEGLNANNTLRWWPLSTPYVSS